MYIFLNLIFVLYSLNYALAQFRECICVRYSNCYANLTIKPTTEPSEFHETLYMDLSTGGRPLCEGPVDVCCFTTSDDPQVDIVDEPAPEPEIAAGEKVLEASDPRCTFYRSFDTGFGVGFEARFNEFPWMVAIMRVVVIDNLEGVESFNYTSHACGGTLISSDTILTAAHCVDDVAADALLARVGSKNLFQKDDQFVDVKIKSVTLHPEYESVYRANDLAVLKLSKRLRNALNVPICLANNYAAYDPQNCIEVGWGSNIMEINKNGGRIKKSEMHLIDPETCRGLHQIGSTTELTGLPMNMLCAVDYLTLGDPCTGDSGSPILCSLKTDKSSYRQVGVASVGKCGESMKPGLFSDVVPASRWIQDLINLGRNPIEEEIKTVPDIGWLNVNYLPEHALNK